MRASVLSLVIALGFLNPGSASAQKIAAIVSSDLGPYREALAGFEEAVGVPVAVTMLGSGTPDLRDETRVVVAFGGRASLVRYPDPVTLIYCLAPGAVLSEAHRSRPIIKIELLPRPGAVLSGIRTLQPSLRHLAILWSSEGSLPCVRDMEQAAHELGIEIDTERLHQPKDLPDILRSLLARKPDALWLPPDPLLISPENFAIVKAFASSNRVAFYAPTRGLVELGAVAAVSVTFREIGRSAGQIARLALDDKVTGGRIYPERSDMSINESAAAACGLRIPAEARQKARKIFP